MGRTWQWLAMASLLGVVGCGEPAVEGGEGVTVETGTPGEGTAATESAPAELPPEIDVIPTNE